MKGGGGLPARVARSWKSPYVSQAIPGHPTVNSNPQTSMLLNLVQPTRAKCTVLLPIYGENGYEMAHLATLVSSPFEQEFRCTNAPLIILWRREQFGLFITVQYSAKEKEVFFPLNAALLLLSVKI